MVGINREVIFVYFGSNGVFSKKKKNLLYKNKEILFAFKHKFCNNDIFKLCSTFCGYKMTQKGLKFLTVFKSTVYTLLLICFGLHNINIFHFSLRKRKESIVGHRNYVSRELEIFQEKK